MVTPESDIGRQISKKKEKSFVIKQYNLTSVDNRKFYDKVGNNFAFLINFVFATNRFFIQDINDVTRQLGGDEGEEVSDRVRKVKVIAHFFKSIKTVLKW